MAKRDSATTGDQTSNELDDFLTERANAHASGQGAAPAAVREEPGVSGRDPRAPRNVEFDDVRGGTLRNKNWAPRNLLPTPDPQDGYDFRWIRTHYGNIADDKNVAGAFQEGWEPVHPDDVPEIMGQLRFVDTKDGTIRIGGMMLCKVPAEYMRQRDAYYAKHAQGQMQSIDNNFLRQSDPRMPVMRPERRSETVRVAGPPPTRR